MDMSGYFNLPDFNPDLLNTAMVKSYVSSMKQEYMSYWQTPFKLRNSWEKGFSNTTNKQSQTNDGNG